MKGIVKRIVDGDTIEVLVKVRMARIDAPETKGKEKPLGEVTKQWLTGRLVEKEIKMAFEGTDYYDRALCEVSIDSVNINDEMVKLQKAEVYTPANHNNGKLDV
jgi:endonuclease YncB( thermonuclease family)